MWYLLRKGFQRGTDSSTPLRLRSGSLRMTCKRTGLLPSNRRPEQAQRAEGPASPRISKGVRILRRAFGLLRMTEKRGKLSGFLCHCEAQSAVAIRIPITQVQYRTLPPNSNEPRLPLMRELSAQLTEGEIPTSIRSTDFPIVHCQLSLLPFLRLRLTNPHLSIWAITGCSGVSLM